MTTAGMECVRCGRVDEPCCEDALCVHKGTICDSTNETCRPLDTCGAMNATIAAGNGTCCGRSVAVLPCEEPGVCALTHMCTSTESAQQMFAMEAAIAGIG